MQMLAASRVLQAYGRDRAESCMLPTLGADTDPGGDMLRSLVVAWIQLLRPTDDCIPSSYLVPEAEAAVLAQGLMHARKDAVRVKGGTAVKGRVVEGPFLGPARQWVAATQSKKN
jgi:hypothetical protein